MHPSARTWPSTTTATGRTSSGLSMTSFGWSNAKPYSTSDPSKGADIELARAKELGMQVFLCLDEGAVCEGRKLNELL